MIQLNWFKTAFRNIRRNISSTIINVGGLTVGFSGAMFLFCLLHYHLSFDDFHPNKDRIYRIVSETNNGTISRYQGVPQPVGKAFKNAYPYAEQVAMRSDNGYSLVTVGEGEDKKLFQISSAYTQPSYFSIFNYPFIKGDASVLGVAGNMVITQKEANRLFPAGDAFGKSVLVNGRLLTIAGILKDLPPNTVNQRQLFISYEDYKIVQPWMASDSSWIAISGGVQCFVLLNKGVNASAVDNALPQFLKQYHPDKNTSLKLSLQPLKDIHFNLNYDGDIEKKQLWGLAVIGIFLLLTASINFINLSTAQIFFRTKETGVRKALGSSNIQIRVQFFIEALLLSLFSLVLSLILVILLFPSFNDFCKTSVSPEALYQYPFVLFVLGMVLIISLLVGYFPGRMLVKLKPVEIMRGYFQQKTSGFSLRKILIVSQFAIVLFMVSCTAIISNQLKSAIQGNLGFKQSGIVLLDIPGERDKSNTITALRNRLSGLSGVKSVSACYASPMSVNNNTSDVVYDNRPPEASFEANIKAVDTGYLSTFDLKLIAGRNLYAGDSINSIIVNEAFLKKVNVTSPEQILGKTIKLNSKPTPIVGVVKDFHVGTFHSEIVPSYLYSKMNYYYSCAVSIDPAQLTKVLPLIEATWKEVYPEKIYSYSFLDEDIKQLYETDITLLKFNQVFTFLVILLGCIGVFGLVSFMAIRKKKEIGIRKVLGAGVDNIVWIFVKEFVRLLLIASAIAIPLSWYFMDKWLTDFAYRLHIGPYNFFWPVLLTFALVIITISVKSINAALANPVKNLRNE
ncbi:ABC transporter permease [Chitinophaga silvatica]|nr:FtsX-like permease family protein [Chitinophaga silvatica]